MDATRFDAMLRTLTTAASRRAALVGLVAGLLAPLIHGLDVEAEGRGGRGKDRTPGSSLHDAWRGRSERVQIEKKKKKKKRKTTPPPANTVPACAPNCAGRTCGDDGCGGSCGTCAVPRSCQGGTCACPFGKRHCADVNRCEACCENIDCCGGGPCANDDPVCYSLVNPWVCVCQGGGPPCGDTCCTNLQECQYGRCILVSDRALKTNVTAIEPADMLRRVRELPITTWNYTSDDPAIRHVGPMAQDFAALFGVGADDRHIHPIDGQGVALAAIQGLAAQVEALREENARLALRLQGLETGPFGSASARAENSDCSGRTAHGGEVGQPIEDPSDGDRVPPVQGERKGATHGFQAVR